MSAVREEEELRREGAADFVAIDIVGRTPWQLFWVRFKRDKVAFAALAFIVLLVLVAILAGPITSVVAHSPNAQFPDALDPIYGTPTGPTSKFLFGVDQVGRDVFSRVLYGAQASLEVALIATALSVSIGVVLGMVAGYFRGWVDTVISRLIDITLAFPILLLALGIASACSLGNGCVAGLVHPGLGTVIVAIVVINWTYIGRIIRGQVLSLREKEFIEAARASGARSSTIIFREILPNLVAPIVVYSTLIIPQNILLEAALSFLGVGIQPPRASWGQMLADATPIYNTAWWYFAFPGGVLVLTVLAFNLLGDGVRDALDPRTST
ncbi:MAG TPA: ABC transporter permease [Gaiellaceae bacterium]|jgi:ABC-type dipeptide/oligopeptide/nickel transport system permease subunit